MNKDFRLILEKAVDMEVPMPATAAAFQINMAEAANSIEEDFSAVIRLVENLARLDSHKDGTGMSETRSNELRPFYASPRLGKLRKKGRLAR